MKKKINMYQKKLKILDKVKKIVRDQGWSEETPKTLLKNNVNQSELTFLFNDDYRELLNFSLEELNKSVEKQIKSINIISYPTNKRIKKILMVRMNILKSDKLFYKKTFNHLLLPTNAKIMKQNLYKSIDNMWYLAGDNSTDFNFYTKRISLAAIYINSLFILFNKDFDKVEINIDKNLKRISKIPKIKSRISFLQDNIPVFVKSFFS